MTDPPGRPPQEPDRPDPPRVDASSREPAPDHPPDPLDENPPDEPPEDPVTAPTLTRPPLSPAARVLLERSRAGLLAAAASRTCSERYQAAHMAALRAAAAVLAVRGRPGSRGGPRSVWEVLPRIAPEMAEWASFFAATATRRAAVEAGRGDAVTPREADDLLRDAEAFHHVVEASFGLPYQQVMPGAYPACI
ncbi:MAG TPA: SAV_6107 family HEPN domain-containing protein [Kineosporiaceae bacterium]|jgi:SAV_6107-like HEPN|nr:SAV_6107 family HEPN domain-containing protein [Kineosporiaceae bacterium]